MHIHLQEPGHVHRHFSILLSNLPLWRCQRRGFLIIISKRPSMTTLSSLLSTAGKASTIPLGSYQDIWQTPYISHEGGGSRMVLSRILIKWGIDLLGHRRHRFLMGGRIWEKLFWTGPGEGGDTGKQRRKINFCFVIYINLYCIFTKEVILLYIFQNFQKRISIFVE